MGVISESDDSDAPTRIRSTQKHKQINKLKNFKFEDSDSSDNENNKHDKSDIKSSVDQDTDNNVEISYEDLDRSGFNLIIDESSKDQLTDKNSNVISNNENNHKDENLPTPQELVNFLASSKMLASPQKTSNEEYSSDNEPINRKSISKIKKKKDNKKQSRRCFNDSSSDEENSKKTDTNTEERKQKWSERKKTKKGINLNSMVSSEEDVKHVKKTTKINNINNEKEDSTKVIESNVNNETLISDVDSDNILKNNDIYDTDNSETDNDSLSRKNKDADSSPTKNNHADRSSRRNKDALNNEEDVDTGKILQNKDIFDMENSGSENEDGKKKDKDVDDHESNGSEEESLTKKKGSKGPKRPNKDSLKEVKSEQQRLLRQQKFRLPYHIPEAKPLKDFLQRVPAVKTKYTKRKKTFQPEVEVTITLNDDGEVIENNNHSSDENKNGIDAESKAVTPKEIKPCIENLFKQKPKLTFSMEGIEFEDDDIEFEDENPEVNKIKKIGPIDSLMARFEKHTRNLKKQNVYNNDKGTINSEIVDDDPTVRKLPGGNRFAFKEQMRRKIKTERSKTLQELERERKMLNEEDSNEEEEEEEEFDDEEDGDDEDEDEEEDGDYQVDENEDDDADGDDGESSNDEELSKWNVEDKRKALEIEAAEAEEGKKDTQIEDKSENSIDFEVEIKKSTQMKPYDKDELMHWDDTSSTVSSFLPAGQGDPSGRKSSISTDGRNTPFSKLLKSGLLDSGSKLNDNTSNSMGAGLCLPCEDTLDLYKEEENVPRKDGDNEESQITSNDFKLTLDEDTQYTQIVDSQGFLNKGKRVKSMPAKRLFDLEVNNGCDDFSMSQVIGLCSGKFDVGEGAVSAIEDGTKSKTGLGENGDDYGKSIPAKRLFGVEVKDGSDEFSMSQIIGLCSGKFEVDEDAVSTSQDCTQSKTGLEENGDEEVDDDDHPPKDHPFSSRTFENRKSSSDKSPNLEKQSQFTDSLESNFSLGISKGIQEKKILAISELIDGNFDNDNAIDFCTAPFLNQSGGKENVNDNAIDFCTAPFSSQGGKLGGLENEMQEKEVGELAENKYDAGNIRNWINDNNNAETGSVGSVSEDVDAKVAADKEIMENDDSDKGESNDEENDEANDEEVFEEGEYEDEDDEDEVVNPELLEYQDAITGNKKKWSKAAFMEKEAELSGSDVNSDDEELGSEYDSYEVDSEAEEDIPTGDKLKDQVHRIHHRKLLDDDQREVRLLQELYFDDGDLGDGKKRQRNFRWRDMGDNEGNVDTTVHSDEEEDELTLDGNISQKIERAEREKYIYELEASDKVSMDENSQSMLEMIKDPSGFIAEKSTPTMKSKSATKTESRTHSQKRSGSFLSQRKSSFSHLSISNVMKLNAKTAKSFVFQATEAEKLVSDKENKAVTRTPSSEPAKKRQKTNDHVQRSESQSIFDLI